MPYYLLRIFKKNLEILPYDIANKKIIADSKNPINTFPEGLNFKFAEFFYRLVKKHKDVTPYQHENILKIKKYLLFS